MSTGKILLALAGGVAAGYIAGILTAPKKGSETREELVEALRAKFPDLSLEKAKEMVSTILKKKQSLECEEETIDIE